MNIKTEYFVSSGSRKGRLHMRILSNLDLFGKKILLSILTLVICSVGCDYLSPEVGVHPTRRLLTGILCQSYNPFSWFCAPDKWFLGQNANVLGLTVYPDTAGGRVYGTDLGFSVHYPVEVDGALYDSTVIYMGDSSDMGNPYLADCFKMDGQTNKRRCNDAITVTVDNDLENGIDSRVLKPDNDTLYDPRYYPLMIPGVNKRPPDWELAPGGTYPDFSKGYNVPAGAAASKNETFFIPGMDRIKPHDRSSRIWMWYAVGLDLDVHDYEESFLACSYNGYDFTHCDPTLDPDLPESFSKHLSASPRTSGHFINVAPVTVTEGELDSICIGNPTSILCGLIAEFGSSGLPPTTNLSGMLLFGSGEYRNSGVFLGYVNFEYPSFRRYYAARSGTWHASEVDNDDAIIPRIEGDRRTWFGELSVQRVNDYLVMLSNHSPAANEQGFIQYRVARLANPETWKAPAKTTALGYGPYIIDYNWSVTGGRLEMYHLISAWRPYGVFSRPLRLEKNQYLMTSELPPWPPSGI